MHRTVDTVVIGGGAAGLMCAIEAGKRGRRVAVLEKSGEVGKKILISGGGRCNFTNIHTSPANYLSQNPHFCKSALARYTPYDFIALVEKHGVSYHEKTLGQQFCDESSRQIIALLKEECDQCLVAIVTDCTVESIAQSDQFVIETAKDTFFSASVVIACGGLSIPKISATDFGHRIAKQFGHSLVTCRPGLVPITFADADLKSYSSLSGTALPTVVMCNGNMFKENFLFTHRGLSGPAILQVSSYWHPGDAMVLDLLPDIALAQELLQRKKNGERTELKNVLGFYFSKKFADALSGHFGLSRPINEYADKQLETISQTVHEWTIHPAGTEGYAKAEVTVGGVDTEELSSKTMESKRVPGLFFIGEVVDVTGHLGGYNFQVGMGIGICRGTSVLISSCKKPHPWGSSHYRFWRHCSFGPS